MPKSPEAVSSKPDVPSTAPQPNTPPPTTPPSTSPITSYPRLATPPRGSIKTPVSHRRNRHPPPPIDLPPMITTPHGVVSLGFVRPSPGSPTGGSSKAHPERENLPVIGEGEEAEEGEAKSVGGAEETGKKEKAEDDKAADDELCMDLLFEDTDKSALQPKKKNNNTNDNNNNLKNN